MTEFKINFYAEIDFKNLPEDTQEEFKKLLLELKTKRTKGKMRIDVEEVKK